eukprot:m.360737 g.360737  ORF g.360737 m.360737 type:complete len:1077 (-) comp19151_c0_seq1:4333-7563(-)
MFNTTSTREATLAQARAAREARQQEREMAVQREHDDKAATSLQMAARGFLARRRHALLWNQRSESMAIALPDNVKELDPKQLLDVISTTLTRYDPQDTAERSRLAAICKHVVRGTLPTTPLANSYFVLLQDKAHAREWVVQTQKLCAACMDSLEAVKDTTADHRNATAFINVLASVADASRWRIHAQTALVMSTVLFKSMANTSLLPAIQAYATTALAQLKPRCTSLVHQALMLMAVRCLKDSPEDKRDTTMNNILKTVMCVPTMLNRTTIKTFDSTILEFVLDGWADSPNFEAFRVSCDINRRLFFLGNVCFAAGEAKQTQESSAALANLATKVISSCLDDVTQPSGPVDKTSSKKTPGRATISSDHPILGWCSIVTPRAFLDIFPQVTAQISTLWTPAFVKAQFEDVFSETTRLAVDASTSETASKTASRFSKLFSIFTPNTNFVNALAAVRVAGACRLYHLLLSTFRASQVEIQGSLAFCSELVPRLWTFLSHIGPKGNFHVFLHAASKDLSQEPLTPCLEVACVTARTLLMVTQDSDIFERSTPFAPDQLVQVHDFLSTMIVHLVWDQDMRVEVPKQRSSVAVAASASSASQATRESAGGSMLRSAATLIATMYELHERVPFLPPIKLKRSQTKAILAEFKINTERQVSCRAHRLLALHPFVLSFLDRVQLFRTVVDLDKTMVFASLPEVRTRPRARIRRRAILSDGFREIMAHPITHLKDAIRISFVNEQGMDEAGIDEEGLFKEFLEETLTQGFHPDFGLFKITEDNKLYPSPSSSVQEQHIRLFEYLGRMLGKMLYDGLVVDVPLSRFFLRGLKGVANTLHDLPSLDAELHRNLLFVKSYEGDVEDLGLTFTVEDDSFGSMVTRPLRPGGGVTDVTNANVILYVHLVADYRLNKQLEAQTKAFRAGFSSIIPNIWLKMFSARELQRLISGDESASIDIRDLKAHTEYVGGYHSGHKMIKWLWEVLESLPKKDQELFLKFATSCSKPPVLGFGALRPPLTVRCMHDGAREESYSIASAMMNALSLSQDSTRLPSSSTCFNLVKLPIYKSKRILKEKLLYAIRSGAGFELA